MAKSVTIDIFGSLCDFVEGVRPADDDRVCRARYEFDARQLAKDAIEGAGVPHPEVDVLIVNGESSAFQRELRSGDHLTVIPKGHPKGAGHPSLVRPPPLPELRFLVDENSVKLARSLLILGFDVEYDSRWDDAELARRSSAESRILLTRDVGLLKRSIVAHGYWLRSDDPDQQTREVMDRFDLWPRVQPFTRCLDCNDRLKSVEQAEVLGEVGEETYSIFKEFFRCPACRKVYWKGSHYDRMREWLTSLRGAPERKSPPERGND